VDPYGELLLIIAAPSVLPLLGAMVGPFAGVAAMFIGLQLALGRSEPWLPRRLRNRMTQGRLAIRLGIWIQRRLRPFSRFPVPRYPRILAGSTAAWSGLLLALPLPVIPFANVVPALALGLVGAGLMARKDLFGWIGTALSGGFTLLVLSFAGAVVAALRRLLVAGLP
jgi:hypothetical protein